MIGDENITVINGCFIWWPESVLRPNANGCFSGTSFGLPRRNTTWLTYYNWILGLAQVVPLFHGIKQGWSYMSGILGYFETGKTITIAIHIKFHPATNHDIMLGSTSTEAFERPHQQERQPNQKKPREGKRESEKKKMVPFVVNWKEKTGNLI